MSAIMTHSIVGKLNVINKNNELRTSCVPTFGVVSLFCVLKKHTIISFKTCDDYKKNNKIK